MTARVRIESAAANHPLVVQTWAKGRDGEPDTLVRETPLPESGSHTEETVWDTQFVVVKEA